jgi:thiamine pyrophosphate-dependent acetolactate synthase large subunit-like protein
MSPELKYGSDLVIDTLRRIGIDYVAMNPGASFRGLHESLVSAGDPQLILALHENTAVAIAEGYARSAGKPMAVFIHNLVGIQNGAMGIFNAWADQVPVLIVGGSGPADAAMRRPWIDWMHSARSQALVARNFLKWDDEPASLAALQDSLVRAARIATTAPQGPCYVSVDVLLQEAETTSELTARQETLPNARLTTSFTVPNATLERIVDKLATASNPVIIADATGRTPEAYDSLVRLAESLAVPVVDLGARLNFPTGHWADATEHRKTLLQNADVVLALDIRDVNFGISEVDHESHGHTTLTNPHADVIHISTNQLMLRGFMDHSSPTPSSVEELIADTSVVLPQLAELAADRAAECADRRDLLRAAAVRMPARRRAPAGGAISKRDLSAAVFNAVDASGPWQVANGLRGAVRSEWSLERFNAHLGRNVGGGLGYGIGLSIGAALAHRGDDTLIVNLQNDGDLMYAASGLWTAAKYELPILTVVVNNRQYGQDHMHQALTARKRGRPLEHAEVGIDLKDPNIDFASLATSQGVEGIGPITDWSELESALARAVKAIKEDHRPVLVDVLVS